MACSASLARLACAITGSRGGERHACVLLPLSVKLQDTELTLHLAADQASLAAAMSRMASLDRCDPRRDIDRPNIAHPSQYALAHSHKGIAGCLARNSSYFLRFSRDLPAHSAASSSSSSRCRRAMAAESVSMAAGNPSVLSGQEPGRAWACARGRARVVVLTARASGRRVGLSRRGFRYKSPLCRHTNPPRPAGRD